MQNQDTIDFSSPIKDYKPGDILKCRILEKNNGGYALSLPDNDLRDAFLPTSVKLREGDELDVLFVFTDGKRIFCSYSDEEFKRRVELKASQDQTAS
ncbi:hypothetical protein KF707_10995 [Candidatus Obscuribacterales bacterium]|jgi:hypothetical protein|nr:hypothetical protein [Candidatus Obscuribacterales bacterium]MBX3136753.1 hypothetical protein [Candidatus Obscuribacterales bacterium]MBX3153808.1 hypothetical protein [Candidatus Obscuribacterales bacterium]